MADRTGGRGPDEKWSRASTCLELASGGSDQVQPLAPAMYSLADWWPLRDTQQGFAKCLVSQVCQVLGVLTLGWLTFTQIRTGVQGTLGGAAGAEEGAEERGI